jgi:outer membrane biosynthesis protein TonB
MMKVIVLIFLISGAAYATASTTATKDENTKTEAQKGETVDEPAKGTTEVQKTPAETATESEGTKPPTETQKPAKGTTEVQKTPAETATESEGTKPPSVTQKSAGGTEDEAKTASASGLQTCILLIISLALLNIY